MRTLRFQVEGQRLDYMPEGAPPVAGSRGWLRASFDMGGKPCGEAVASFWAGGEELAARLEGGGCAVPDGAAALPEFEVSLTVREDGGAVYPTNRVKVFQEAM